MKVSGKLFMAFLISFFWSPVATPAQSYEVQQLLLDVEKLAQLKNILKDLQEGYQVLEKGYSTIRDLSKGSFDLHQAFLDGLLVASPTVRNYKRVADILQLQASLLDRCKTAWSKFRQDPHFHPEELELMGNLFGRLLDQSGKDLEVLASVLTDGKLRAGDAERLNQIDGVYTGLLEKSVLLDRLSASAILLSQQRAASQADWDGIRKLYGADHP